MGQYLTQAYSILATQLANEGERIVNECLEEKDYTHRTKNLHDSYGYGVYVKGKLVKKYSTPQEATEGVEWYKESLHGHEEIEKFFKDYRASKGIELVIVAAMPYAEVLENASSGQKRKYKVISMSYDKLKAVAHQSKIPVTVSRIVRGKLQNGNE